ncbi:MAG: pyridoxamine 5'-phosphate oxidase family protein [Pseudomonadota bacterium]
MSDPNDLTGFLSRAWQILGRGVADRRSPARHPTFATVSPDGLPQARTVVLRAADRATAMLEIHTDTASAKIAALRAHPQAEVHIWDARSKIQLRLAARVSILTGAETADRWASVPEASRVSYGTEPAPGSVIGHVYAYEKPPCADRFAVLSCALEAIDLVHLDTRHRRARYTRASEWSGNWLAP